MRATSWEFKNRALIFGLIFGVSFSMYSFDHRTATDALAHTLAALLGIEVHLLDRVLFALAAFLLAVAALIRTWASSYLHASVVYASAVQTGSLVADGPYRRVRNPLYFANIFLAIGLGAMMSRIGFVVALATMFLFCYRLILREESEFRASQGELYEQYRRAVPRLFPSLRPRILSGGSQPDWAEGFRSEFWYWGFAVSVAAFAITLSPTAFYVILTASIVVLWLSTWLVKSRPAPTPTPQQGSTHPPR